MNTVSAQIVDFFKRYGEWEDINRVVMLANRGSIWSSDLFDATEKDSRDTIVASCLLRLCKNRAAELFATDASEEILTQIVKSMPNKMFGTINSIVLQNLLDDPKEKLRKIVALKIVLCKSKREVSNILSNYLDNNIYYYDSVLWLDLGVSLKQDLARTIARAQVCESF
ncbi:MAG: hypothetical protein RIM72_23470 [Alphaproteobacteria bacterium]